MKHIVKSCASIMAVSLAPAALAQTTVYKGYDPNTTSGYGATSEPNSNAAAAQFGSTLGNGVATESFEGFPTGKSAPLMLDFTGSNGTTLTATLTGDGSVQSAPQSDPTSSGQFATDGSNYYEVTSSDFGVTFGSAIAAFGFYATDIESDVQLILGHATGPSETFSFASLFPSQPYGTEFAVPSGSVNFLGFVNVNNPYTSISFSQGNNSSGDILAFDQFTIADRAQVVNPPSPGVPEPATWITMFTGFGAIGGILRSRRRLAAGRRTVPA